MSSDEWLGIVAWVNQRIERKWTVDQAARLGVLFRSFDASVVRGAISRLLDRGDELTPRAIKAEMQSRYGGILEAKHRRLFPRGCTNKFCDVCLDNRPPIRHNVLHD